jgi:transcriptional regulator with XRE-family HTH domain
MKLPDFSNTEGAAEMRETSEATIGRILSQYDLGRKLRALRLRKKIALSDLARHTGLSASMLSQLETGKLFPTLPTLVRIAVVFDVGIEHFFERKGNARTFVVIRRDERMRFPEKPETTSPAYFFECLAFAVQGKLFEAYLADFPPHGPGDVIAHQHEGAEFVYVIENTLIIRASGQDYALDAGDSVYFDPADPHSYRSAGANPAKALVITSPARP